MICHLKVFLPPQDICLCTAECNIFRAVGEEEGHSAELLFFAVDRILVLDILPYLDAAIPRGFAHCAQKLEILIIRAGIIKHFNIIFSPQDISKGYKALDIAGIGRPV